MGPLSLRVAPITKLRSPPFGNQFVRTIASVATVTEFETERSLIRKSPWLLLVGLGMTCSTLKGIRVRHLKMSPMNREAPPTLLD
jgi:hypothetical protein